MKAEKELSEIQEKTRRHSLETSYQSIKTYNSQFSHDFRIFWDINPFYRRFKFGIIPRNHMNPLRSHKITNINYI